MTASQLPWRAWLRMALRVATFGLFFVNRRSFVMRLLRSTLSCLTILLMSGTALVILLLWWLFM